MKHLKEEGGSSSRSTHSPADLAENLTRTAAVLRTKRKNMGLVLVFQWTETRGDDVQKKKKPLPPRNEIIINISNKQKCEQYLLEELILK